jgi:carboxyl-terminal processing protease
LQSHYYGKPIDEAKTRTLTYEAVKGLLASLNDQFSSYLDASQWQQLVTMTEGRFGGIGALMEQSADGIRISRPAAGGPAEKAGLRAGDVLVSIDGHPVKGQALDDLGQWLEGDLQTTVTLEVLRGSQRLTVPVVRENIEPPVVEHWMEDNGAGIGHIVLTEFNRKSASQIDAAYSDLETHGLRALVLDLRFNPGGLLDSAVDVASIFIPEDSKPPLRNNVVIIHHGDGEEEGLTLEPQKKPHRKVPLAVLVNGASASAAEIVTGAIKDYETGIIIGERTFGKGKVQTLFEMNHGRDGGIRLTTSIYYPPNGHDINFQHDDEGNRVAGTGGIIPDLLVPAATTWQGDFDDKANDNQLKAAVDYLKARLAGRTAIEATRIALGR